jgi:hypothetical protein
MDPRSVRSEEEEEVLGGGGDDVDGVGVAAGAGRPRGGDDPDVISEAVLVKSTSNPRNKGESVRKFLGRITHLNLNGKNLRRIVRCAYARCCVGEGMGGMGGLVFGEGRRHFGALITVGMPLRPVVCGLFRTSLAVCSGRPYRTHCWSLFCESYLF